MGLDGDIAGREQRGPAGGLRWSAYFVALSHWLSLQWDRPVGKTGTVASLCHPSKSLVPFWSGP